MVQGIILVILCLLIRRFKWRYLLAFAVAVVYGYTVNFFLWILGPISFDAVWLRWIMLIAGNLITGFGVACFFNTYLSQQIFELFVSELTQRYGLEIGRVKWLFDISLLAVSVILALALFRDAAEFHWPAIGHTSFHNLGLGTLVTTAINSPIIQFMSRQIKRHFESSPRFPRLETALRRA